MPSLPPHTSLLLLFGGGGDQLSCAGPGCGDSLSKCPDVRRTPCEPPICTSWNICRAGTSHLKGVQQRADTTQRSALHRAHHLRWQARGSPWWRNTNTHTHTWSGLTCQRDTWTRAHLSGAGRRSVAVPAPLCTARRRTDQFCAVSVLFLKCPVQLRGCCSRCVQQGAPTCRHTWDNPGAQESKGSYRKSITPHFTCQGKSWVFIRQHVLNLFLKLHQNLLKMTPNCI